jgi:hypothetical protein
MLVVLANEEGGFNVQFQNIIWQKYVYISEAIFKKMG